MSKKTRPSMATWVVVLLIIGSSFVYVYWGTIRSLIPQRPMSTPAPPAVPTLLPAVLQAPQFQGALVQSTCLTVSEAYDPPRIHSLSGETSLPVAETIATILSGLGMRVVEPGGACDAEMTISINGYSWPTAYSGGRYCYSGGRCQAEIALTLPDSTPYTRRAEESWDPAATLVNRCPSEPSLEWFDCWETALLDWLVDLWGPRVYVHALGSYVSSKAVDALKASEPDQELIAALAHALQSEDESTAGQAITVLRAMGPEAVVDGMPFLIQALQHKNANVRRYAADALGEIGPQAMQAVPALIHAMAGEGGAVRKSAEQALQRITGQDLGTDAAGIEAWWTWWRDQG